MFDKCNICADIHPGNRAICGRDQKPALSNIGAINTESCSIAVEIIALHTIEHNAHDHAISDIFCRVASDGFCRKKPRGV